MGSMKTRLSVSLVLVVSLAAIAVLSWDVGDAEGAGGQLILVVDVDLASFDAVGAPLGGVSFNIVGTNKLIVSKPNIVFVIRFRR